jgi:hypothetical protein
MPFEYALIFIAMAAFVFVGGYIAAAAGIHGPSGDTRLIDAVSRAWDSVNRGILAGGALALLFSPNAVFGMVFTAAGVTGSSLFTAAFYISCIAGITLLSLRRITLLPADYAFVLLLLAVIGSFAMNGTTTSPKESALLFVSLAAYPACRFISVEALREIRISFGTVSGAIAAIGAIATTYAIVQQWPVTHGKPVVLGADAGATFFLVALGYAVLVLTTQPLTLRQSVLLSALIFLPTAIFAAALVRFSFVALLASLVFAALLSPGSQRPRIAIIVTSIVLAMMAGILCRSDKIPVLIGFMTEKTATRDITASPASPTGGAATVTTGIVPPSCTMAVNMKNSFAQRKALWRDSVYLIPFAGAVGIGLDGFMKYSCMIGFPPHSSLMQALIEFGWIGGLALLVMGVLGFAGLYPRARHDENFRFILCTLAYAVMISFAHGRISRDMVLFAMLGLATAAFESVARQRSSFQPSSPG